eukprot:1160610-Pelagomonas_calceolata.AAC.1
MKKLPVTKPDTVEALRPHARGVHVFATPVTGPCQSAILSTLSKSQRAFKGRPKTVTFTASLTNYSKTWLGLRFKVCNGGLQPETLADGS